MLEQQLQVVNSDRDNGSGELGEKLASKKSELENLNRYMLELYDFPRFDRRHYELQANKISKKI